MPKYFLHNHLRLTEMYYFTISTKRNVPTAGSHAAENGVVISHWLTFTATTPRSSVTKLPNWSSMCFVTALMCTFCAETNIMNVIKSTDESTGIYLLHLFTQGKPKQLTLIFIGALHSFHIFAHMYVQFKHSTIQSYCSNMTHIKTLHV